MASPCIFCDIIKGNSKTVIEYENEELVIFKDIKPASDHHYLAVPKKHIQNVKCLKSSDTNLLDNLETSLRELLVSKDVNIEDSLFGFHWPPFISVGHLHMHAMGPVSNMSFVSKCVFKPGIWFTKPDYVRKWIRSKN